MKKIDKNVVYLGWVSFFTDMASSMITTLLPIFIVYILNEGVDKLGIIIAIATFVSYAFRIFFGYISDKYQIVKPFVVSGYLISACAKPFLAVATTYVSVALVRVTDRMGKAIRSASKDALISSYVKQTGHGRTFGFHKMMDIAGELSGALLVFLAFLYFAQDENTIRTIFGLSVIPGVFAVLIVVLLVKDMPESKKTTRTVIKREDLKLFWLLFLYFGFVFFLMSEQFFIVKAKEEGFSLGMIPPFIDGFYRCTNGCKLLRRCFKR